MAINFSHGTPLMIDHTPGSAVDAGDIVIINQLCCVAHLDIAANALGAVAFPSGNAVYDVPLQSGAVYAAGEQVFVDLTTMDAHHNETGAFFGYAVAAATQSSSVTTVRAVHCLEGGNAAS